MLLQSYWTVLCIIQNISGTPDFVIVIFFIGYLFSRLSKYFIFIFLTILRLHRLLPETVKRQVIFRLSYSTVHANLVKIIASSPGCCNYSCAKYSPPLLTVQNSTYTQPKFFVQWKLENTKNCRRHSYTPGAAAMIKGKEACVAMARSILLSPSGIYLLHLSTLPYSSRTLARAILVDSGPSLYPSLQFL